MAELTRKYHIATKQMPDGAKQVGESMDLADARSEAEALSVGWQARAKSAYFWSMPDGSTIGIERDESAGLPDIKAISVFETAHQATPEVEKPTDVSELAIWWLTQEDCELIGGNLPNVSPEYLKSQYRSRLGRPGRGRLWVDDDEGFGITDIEWPEGDHPIAEHCSYCGGIVMWRKDLDALAILPGLVTDMHLNRL
jgi:hypothetical protein